MRLIMKRRVRFDEVIMGKFLERHDLVYDKTAAVWDKGVPLANSLVSALIWGEDRINVTLNRLDVWEMRRYQPDPEKYKWRYFENLLKEDRDDDLDGLVQTHDNPGPTAQQLPVGRFEVSTKGKRMDNYSMRLSLYDAIANGCYNTEYGSIQWRCHVSAKQPVIIFNYKIYGDEEVNIKFRFCSELNEYNQEYQELSIINPSRAGGKSLNGTAKLVRGYKKLPEFSQILKDWGYPAPERFKEEEVECFKQAIPENGNYAVAWTIFNHGDNEKSIIVSLASDPEIGKAEVEAIKTVKGMATKESLVLEVDEHKRWWHDFYPKSFYSISDTKLEGLYWINLYKLGCQTRKEGIAPPMSGPWQPDNGVAGFLGNTYIWNTQQQMNLFGIYTGNRLELAETTYNLLIDNRHKMAEYCKNFFEVDGEFLPHLTDWKLNCPNFTSDHFELISGPWMCQLMWNHYRYTLDRDFLRDTLYPMMRAQCKTLLSLLEKEEDGKLHFPYTMSAEYPPNNYGNKVKKRYENRYGPDATCDLAYTRFMCETLIEATEILGIEDEDRASWEAVIEDLSPFCLDEFGGLMVRRDQPLISTHRHHSHLFPITQLYQITYDTPEGKSIIDSSLRVLKLMGTGEWMGWTFSETAKIALLAEKPSLAYSMLHDYSDKFIQENTFDCDGSNNDSAFTIHSNIGLTVESDGMFNDALQGFAVRSFNNTIYVMDILPQSWLDISFWNFRTEGAFLISAQRRDGITDFISVYSEMGGTVRLKSCYGVDIDIMCDERMINYETEGNLVIFNTNQGNEYIITKAGERTDNLLISAVTPYEHEINFFGVKKRSRY